MEFARAAVGVSPYLWSPTAAGSFTCQASGQQFVPIYAVSNFLSSLDQILFQFQESQEFLCIFIFKMLWKACPLFRSQMSQEVSCPWFFSWSVLFSVDVWKWASRKIGFESPEPHFLLLLFFWLLMRQMVSLWSKMSICINRKKCFRNVLTEREFLKWVTPTLSVSCNEQKCGAVN